MPNARRARVASASAQTNAIRKKMRLTSRRIFNSITIFKPVFQEPEPAIGSALHPPAALKLKPPAPYR
jgi:hypothetical protein